MMIISETNEEQLAITLKELVKIKKCSVYSLINKTDLSRAQLYKCFKKCSYKNFIKITKVLNLTTTIQIHEKRT